MIVLDSSGKYEPGEGGWLSLAFKPIMEVRLKNLLSVIQVIILMLIFFSCRMKVS